MIWSGHLIGFAVILQALEHLWIYNHLRPLDPWQEDSPLDRIQILLHFGRLIGGIGLLIFLSAACSALVFLSVYLTAVRYRGTFNGGSDTTTLHLLGALILWQIWPELEYLSVTYLALYVCLSYFVAGVSKVIVSDWRKGVALPRFLFYSNSAWPSSFGERFRKPASARGLAWVIMIWEVLFPLALLHPVAAVVLTAIGLIFHIANYYFFGLNRFFWVWLAGYPAIFAFHQLRH